MLLSELPNEGPRDLCVLQERTIRTDHHTPLTPGEHDVRPPMVLQEPRAHGPGNRNDDMICFVTLEGVNVEYRILPGEICDLQGALNLVALGVVGGDDLVCLSFLDVAPRDSNNGSHFSLILGRYASARTTDW